MQNIPLEFSRTQLLIGCEGIHKLQNAAVAVFGLGGVGSFVVEALARAGVGTLSICDNDKIAPSNINRQLIALHSTLGMQKADAVEARIHDINPNCKVEKHLCFYTPENADEFDLSRYDYIVDAVDMVTAKLELAVRATKAGVPMISSMGAGNKMDPTKFEVADISETSVCPLARVMRRELRARGVEHLKVVYSKEPPLRPRQEETSGQPKEAQSFARRATPGSVPFVPSVAGLIIAGEVIKDITGWKRPE
jgi:tRNA A37 threonylcarbamoyladenosine dehydratase